MSQEERFSWLVKRPRDWGVVLASGPGNRLSAITELISEDNRPMQFCPFFFGRTLVEQAQARLEHQISPDRTLIALNREHEPFYRTSLDGVAPLLRLEQPSDRGTTPAIIYSLLRIIGRDPDALVVFSPSDHHYTVSHPYLEAIRHGLEIACHHPQSLVLLGANATFSNAEDGLIEPSSAECSGHNNCFGVDRFRGKPELPTARELQSKGWLCNTSVMIGRGSAFLLALTSTVPSLLAAFEETLTRSNPRTEAENMDRLYQGIEPSAFSKDVLPYWVENLLVLKLRDSGWSDLGTPGVFIERMSQMGFPSPAPTWNKSSFFSDTHPFRQPSAISDASRISAEP